ncbi:AraC family transcriptional regulator [Nocardia tenerifensis]|uniref:AraC family transcriptional regulator n=1 Tax=Nocardia tenerifensis TaxID=228006 RepID=A0A318KDL8_9NOCA|nr:AraC family transcriptional regulator [Nocardia tenerifensis]PXX57403.1 AraC family transcriptional regulator [Nocardia tenerifensis]
MFDGEFRRGTAGVRALIALAEERGVSGADCLSGTMLTPGDIECTAEQELLVVRNVVERLGAEPGLGAAAGGRAELPPSGPWGLALLSSRTLGDAVDVAARYLDRTSISGRVIVEETANTTRVRFDRSECPPDLRAFLAERILAAVKTIGGEMFETGIPPARVEFRHAPPANLGRYREIFGMEPIFGAETDAMTFDRRALDLPAPKIRERARGACAQFCRELVDRQHTRSGVAGAVRNLLVRNPGAIPDQIAVANELFMSPRTLSRRLNEEDVSFRGLLDEVRQLMSEQLLVHTALSTEQVAARLGYAEAASFIRAFRRWKGCPPQEFRLHRDRAGAPPRAAVAAGVH